MESDAHDMFHEKRRELRGGCSDQGTEKGMGDESIYSVGFDDYNPTDAFELFLCPLILWIPGMLHVLYNALQDAIESVSESKLFSTS